MSGGAAARARSIAALAGWCAGVALAVALAMQSLELLHAQRVNRELARLLAAGDAAVPAPSIDDARLAIVEARAPARSGQIALAAAQLRHAADATRAPLRAIAEYDLADLYLRGALRAKAQGADAAALPLFELAKEAYRAALLDQPDLWDAKFNLELALRVAPDPDPDDNGAPPIMTGERAVTTMRAFTLGLP